ncbi:Protein of unknown function [Gryllus bimaculatus]|nr:Protein of unknown function [Gryllus bimaculatus]
MKHQERFCVEDVMDVLCERHSDERLGVLSPFACSRSRSPSLLVRLQQIPRRGHHKGPRLQSEDARDQSRRTGAHPLRSNLQGEGLRVRRRARDRERRGAVGVRHAACAVGLRGDERGRALERHAVAGGRVRAGRTLVRVVYQLHGSRQRGNAPLGLGNKQPSVEDCGDRGMG